MNIGSLLKGLKSHYNYQDVVDACNRTVSSLVTSFSTQNKVELLDGSRINSLEKCDSSMYFSVYAERNKNPMYFVVYVPRFLVVFRSKLQSQIEDVCARFNVSIQLVQALEKSLENTDFIELMEKLRESVLNNAEFRSIHHASACGFARAVYTMCCNVNAEILLNEVSGDGRLPLQIAAENDEKETLHILLNLGANIQKQDCHGCNVVHYAAQKNSALLQVISNYTAFKSAIDARDEYGQTPLCYSLLASRSDCAELLLKAGCFTGPYSFGPLAKLISACESTPDLLKTIDTILLYYPSFLSDGLSESSTILHEELSSMVLNHLLELSQADLDINARDKNGQTPLHLCICRKNLSQALILLSHNADVNAINQDGNTPLHLAVQLHLCKLFQQGTVKLVKLLLIFNADVFCKNKIGISPLNYAGRSCGFQKEGVLECLEMYARHSVPATTSENILADFMQEQAIAEVLMLPFEERRSVVNALSLDGGGIKGLITVQILLHIQKMLKFPLMQHFSWIAGTSTGAILALSLARGDTLEGCRNLYLKMKDIVFLGKRPYADLPLEEFLQSHFGLESTMAQLSPKKVVVTATSVRRKPLELKLFRSYRLPLSSKETETLEFNDPNSNITWKCARYSSAAPTYFLPKDGLVDGGLIANNPTLDLLSEIHEYNVALIKSKQKAFRIGCILSIGTGLAPTEVLADAKYNFRAPSGPIEGLEMFLDALNLKDLLIEQITSSDGECVRRARSFAHSNRIPFFRFSPELSFPVELDVKSDEVIVEFLWDTEKYLRTNGQSYVVSLVNYLNSLM